MCFLWRSQTYFSLSHPSNLRNEYWISEFIP